MNKRWIAFFSQSGTELLEIIEKTGIVPDLIVTNKRSEKYRTINPTLIELYGDRFVSVSNKPTEQEYREVLGNFIFAPIVTLHGWLRIIPESICSSYDIYNGHPGDIINYPELKGKDPQVRAFQEDYKTAGVVIHKVIPQVDEGEILKYKVKIPIRNLDLTQLFTILRVESVKLWVQFINERMY